MRIDGSFGERDLPQEGGGLREVLNRTCLPLWRRMLAWINRHSFTLEFTDDDLAAGVLTCTHPLGSSVVSLSLIDGTGALRYDLLGTGSPTVVSDSEVTVDLSSVAPISDTWILLVRRD